MLSATTIRIGYLKVKTKSPDHQKINTSYALKWI